MKRNKDVAEGFGAGLEALEPRKLLAFAGLPFQIGSSGVDVGQQVLATPDGGFIAAGLFAGTVDFDPSAGSVTRTSVSDTDVFIAKYDSSGALVWVQQIGGNGKKGKIKDQEKILDIDSVPERAGDLFIHGVSSAPKNAGEYINDLALDSNGDIVIAGEFIGKMTVTTIAGPQTIKTFDNDFYDAFVAKLDASGQIRWFRQIGDRFTDTANAVAIDPSDNILVTGLFTRTVNFAPGRTGFIRNALGRADGYTMKLGPGGVVQWVNQFGAGATDQPVRDAGNDVTTDAAGNVYVAGEFGGKADFDPGPGVYSIEARDLTDGILLKYSSAGRFRAALPYAGRSYDALTHVQVDSQMNIYVAGYFQGKTFDVDPTSLVQNLVATPRKPSDSDPKFLDVFVEKLSRGSVEWVQRIAGTKVEFINDMRLDQDEQLVLSGAFYGKATFGNGPTLQSVKNSNEFKDRNDDNRDESYDAFLWRMSSAGGTFFVDQFGSNQDDFGEALSIGADNSIVLIGRFRSTVDFDPGPGQSLMTGLGLADAFVAAFDSLGNAQF